MRNELRKNPRFVSGTLVPARFAIDGRELAGTIRNFSSTGFAIVLAEPLEDAIGKPVEASFEAAGQAAQPLKLSAVVTNLSPDEGGCRLGCHISDTHGRTDEYLAFLTNIMFSQGFLKSMATKPVKYRPSGSS